MLDIMEAHTFDAHELADVRLTDADGTTHRLGDLWTDRPHVLLFLRHFG